MNRNNKTLGESTMKTKLLPVAAAVTCLLASSAMAQATFTDDFNRADTDRDTDASVSVGAGYVLTKGAGEMDTTGGINDNQFGFGWTGSGLNPNHIGLHYAGLELKNSAPGESFVVEGDILTHSVAAGAYYYGLMFNYQPDGTFYAARLRTSETAHANLTIVKWDGTKISFLSGGIVDSDVLEPGSVYHLKIESSSPGVFDYTLTGAGLGPGLTGTATDTGSPLEGGYAGFYANGTGVNDSVRFDNLSVTVLPARHGGAAHGFFHRNPVAGGFEALGFVCGP